MNAKRHLASTGLTLIALGAIASAQQDANGKLKRISHVGNATLNLKTGEIIRGPGGAQEGSGLIEESCYVNTDTSGFYATGGADKSDTWLDWAIFQNRSSGIVTSFSFGYATSQLDTTGGGPGASVCVSFYDGATGFCADSGAQPTASFSFTGLPAATTGLPTGFGAGWVITVDITGGFEFEKNAGPFGFAISGGGNDGTGGAQTGPLLCYVGDGSGGPDNNGGVDAFDIWVPDLRGVCSGTFFFGGPPLDISSWYATVNQADEDANIQASAVFLPGVPPNPPDFIVTCPPNIGGSFKGVINCSKGNPLYFVLGWLGAPPINVNIGPCRTIICDITQPEVLFCGPNISGVPFCKPVGNNINNLGLCVCVQGVCIGGGLPFYLTNAFDCKVGFKP